LKKPYGKAKKSMAQWLCHPYWMFITVLCKLSCSNWQWKKCQIYLKLSLHLSLVTTFVTNFHIFLGFGHENTWVF
jgi:hypothetical protein